jgi:hypothetical protein
MRAELGPRRIVKSSISPRVENTHTGVIESQDADSAAVDFLFV